MKADCTRGLSALIGLLVGAAALGGAITAVADPAYAFAFGNPGMNSPPPGNSPQQGSTPPEKPKEDHHDKPDPNLDVLEGLGGINVGGPGRRPGYNGTASATGAGTPGDEAAANDAVAAAAAARAAKPRSNIDMSDEMRAERCANNRARIAELERMLAQLSSYAGSLSNAEARSAHLFDDLPASSADYALVRAEVKGLKTAMAGIGDRAALQSQLAEHRNNLIALGC